MDDVTSVYKTVFDQILQTDDIKRLLNEFCVSLDNVEVLDFRFNVSTYNGNVSLITGFSLNGIDKQEWHEPVVSKQNRTGEPSIRWTESMQKILTDDAFWEIYVNNVLKGPIRKHGLMSDYTVQWGREDGKNQWCKYGVYQLCHGGLPSFTDTIKNIQKQVQEAAQNYLRENGKPILAQARRNDAKERIKDVLKQVGKHLDEKVARELMGDALDEFLVEEMMEVEDN